MIKIIFKFVLMLVMFFLWGWFSVTNYEKTLTLGILFEFLVLTVMIAVAVVWFISDKESES